MAITRQSFLEAISGKPRNAAEWQARFTIWAKGPGVTESDMCTRAEIAVKKAIEKHPELSKMLVTAFAQGSYRARTNTPGQSDVDICVRLKETFYPIYPAGKTRVDFGHGDGMKFETYKGLVGHALVTHFGAPPAAVRGKKAFDIRENTYRIDADVIPAIEHRIYTGRTNADGTHHYYEGIAFFPDGGTEWVVNWPEHTYQQGLKKHEKTGRRYRKIVRILKRLRDKMNADRIAAANVPSFLIDCLAWNVGDGNFGKETLYEDVYGVLLNIWGETREGKAGSDWLEVNQIKALFGPGQGWTMAQANQFAWECMNYVEFK